MTTTSLQRVALLALGACSVAPVSVPSGTTTTPPTNPPRDPCGDCFNVVRSVLPARDAQGVHTWPTFVVTFLADEIDTAVFQLDRADGTATEIPLGTVTWAPSGKVATVRPAAPLDPSTAYTFGISYSCSCGRPSAVNFTTGAVGEAVAPADVSGVAYGLDLATGTLVDPPGVQSLLASLVAALEGQPVLVPAWPGEDAALALTWGFAAEVEGVWVQDVCSATADLAGGEVAPSPWFTLAAEDVTLAWDGTPLVFPTLEVSGAFAPGGEALSGLLVRGVLDTRPLVPFLGEDLGADPTDDAVCDLFATLTSGAVACVPCGDDGARSCLPLTFVDVTAERLDGLELVPRAPEVVAEDSTCAADTP